MSEPLFKTIGDEVQSAESGVTEIESVCAKCFKDGTTRLLLTEIPFYKQVVIISFECKECGFSNNELQPAAQIQEQGINYTIKCKGARDLNRRVVKTEAAEIYIPELEFEVSKQTGLITTIEGIIERAISGLRFSIQNCEAHTPEDVQKISSFLTKFEQLKNGEEEFTFILDDPSGNSFIENPVAPQKDPQMEVRRYVRSFEQSKLLGMVPDDMAIEDSNPLLDELSNKNEVLQFAIQCSNCTSPCFTNMKITHIPHFKEIVLMVTLCDKCGYKTNEIKSAGGIEAKGSRHVKKVKNENDLKHDCVKSDTCSLEIPELELKLDSSGNGRYTTIEGLIETVKDQLKESNPFFDGDSEESVLRAKFQELIKRLDNIVGLTIVLDDPCGNSFIENADSTEHYERSNEQNEELGLNDMKTENYS